MATPMMSDQPSGTEGVGPDDRQQTPGGPARIGAAFWRASVSSRVLLVMALITLALVGIALWIPQLPSQLQGSPAAANRWLLAARTQFGTLGSLLGALGLFDLLHNPAFRLLLAALIYLLSAQTARLVGIALAYRRLPDRADVPVSAPGRPVDLPSTLPLIRRRNLVESTPDVVQARVAMEMDRLYGHLRLSSIPLSGSTWTASGNGTGNETGETEAIDLRVLGLHARLFTWLRPLAMLGLALAVVGLWINAQQGWEVNVPALAAGDSYRYPPRDLEIAYTLDDSAENLSIALNIELDGRQITLPVTAANRARIGGVRVRADADIPGVVVRTRPAAVSMNQPGEPATDAAIGLSFPMVASEESILIPDEAVGIRLVRLPQSEEMASPFIVEVFDAALSEAALSEPRDLSEIEVISLSDTEIRLELTPVPGLSIRLRSAPGEPLIRLGLVLALIGAVGWVQRPRFALVQIAPWGREQSVVTVQASTEPAFTPDTLVQGEDAA